ncbi:MAG TPA: tetratricopeptide repeat protein [Polyangiaceae bacterium]|jgi:Flp pilus assembly protein TadD
MTQDGSTPPSSTDSVREVASEEFLFHLYRGAELLQDSRVHEAKEELEAALHLQPRDSKGQDLLAVVYFRMGVYPRAIQIYEQLHRDNPRDTALMVNLALCYLKTGQSQSAREVLEALVQIIPEHRRAWGYLGLAYERLGDLEKAEHAFGRAGHEQMARRVAAQRGQSMAPPVETETTRIENAAIRATAAVAFQELDSGELSFALAEPASHRSESGTWRAIELGTAVRSPSAPPPPIPSLQPALPSPTQLPNVRPSQRPPAPPRAPRTLTEIAAATRVGSTDAPVRLLSSGLVVVTTAFAARLGALRAYAGALTTTVLERQTRTPSPEPFGGMGNPLVRMNAASPILLGPRSAHRLVPIALEETTSLFVREDLVLGFELALTFENGRLTFGETDAMAVAQFKGAGTVVLELIDAIVSLDVTAGRPAVARREALVGWTGRVLPRAIPISEAPSGQRGLVAFSGEGTVLVAGR